MEDKLLDERLEKFTENENDYEFYHISEDTIKLIVDVLHSQGYDSNRIATIVANIINIDYELKDVDIDEEDD